MPYATAKHLDRRTLSKPALKAFFRIAELWELTIAQQINLLGNPARSTFFNWRKHEEGQLAQDTLERISYILGIYKALQVLLPNEAAADEWIKKPNKATIFGGQSALDYLLSGHVADLYVVRQYLDAQRGGWA